MTITQVITALPSPPNPVTDTPSTFATKAAAMVIAQVAEVTELNTFGTQVNATAVTMNADAATATAQAAASSASASAAAGSATAAAAGAGTSLWVSGTTYTAITSIVVSPIDYRSYRRTITGAGTTDPSADATNWVLISAGTLPMLKVSERYATNTIGVSLTASDLTQTRVFNTVDLNTIAGASLASNEVTLPAGTYDVDIACQVQNTSGIQHFLYNTTDSAYTLDGATVKTAEVNGTHASTVTGRFTIAATKSFKVRYYSAGGGQGGGQVNSTRASVHGEATFIKVA